MFEAIAGQSAMKILLVAHMNLSLVPTLVLAKAANNLVNVNIQSSQLTSEQISSILRLSIYLSKTPS